MPGRDRREFIKALLSGGAAAALYPSLARAFEIPAHTSTGTIQDVEHVVILTQENRAFDHYFGALNGVRGFGDRFVIPAPDVGHQVGRTVFVQPNEDDTEPHLIAPFRLNTRQNFAVGRHDGTPHGFTDGQAAWDNGRMGQWTRSKHNHSMGHFTREDIPFQYALAEAFTLCDAYHSAMHLCTNPNRLYIWTGTHDPLGQHHGPAIDNAYDSLDADGYGHGGYTWTTYPERLLAAGVSFQIYQLMEDNFTDNPVVGFKVFRDAMASRPRSPAQTALVERTLTTRGLDRLKSDVMAGHLPQVSWIVAPAAYSEHPDPSSPFQGAEYTAQVLDALTANPAVWAKTALIVNFDENDGLFDHVPPPAPPARDPKAPERYFGGSTVPVDDEYHVKSQNAEDAQYLNRPYGLGPRVPMYVVSPWSRGGYVSSEVFDHTSILRFLELRFGVAEPNISQWRRAVCGDLTSCFNFRTPNDTAFRDRLPETRTLSDRAGALPRTRPFPPETLTAPVQEAGPRRRRATPYRLDLTVAPGRLTLRNDSRERAAVFHVYDLDRLTANPRRYTVGAGRSLDADLPDLKSGADLFILGPGGFHRRFTATALRFTASVVQDAGGVYLRLTNLVSAPLTVQILDLSYGQPSRSAALESAAVTLPLDLSQSHNWYDLEVLCDGQVVRLAGYVETGGEGVSDPAAFGPALLNRETKGMILSRT
ncbi:phosphocholine-specific phospholipase C [Asticcacaulis sp. 201]|uniref:phosphocholine-specific phospholipase C n=1 Tax=Asticcacaulis sp. 201 TaxID=3028787 RepID=UPI0029168DF9|nr:phospholipase C, phosphocholine-specific [Asticcacaulis sp. 201]MDV6330927.1 phospholipase C, phosphocholine-specific [Asticcacaulis sp. 201]